MSRYLRPSTSVPHDDHSENVRSFVLHSLQAIYQRADWSIQRKESVMAGGSGPEGQTSEVVEYGTDRGLFFCVTFSCGSPSVIFSASHRNVRGRVADIRKEWVYDADRPQNELIDDLAEKSVEVVDDIIDDLMSVANKLSCIVEDHLKSKQNGI